MVRAESFRAGPSRTPITPPFRAQSFSEEIRPGRIQGRQRPAKIANTIIETSSAQISFFEAGSQSDLPALVLLPGLFCSAQRFINAMLPFADKTRLLAIDWRGHGQSFASKGFQVKDLAADVMAVIRMQLKGSKVCIMTHSMGARVLWSMLDIYKGELSAKLEGVAIIDQGPAASTGKSSKGPHDHEHAMFKRDSHMISLGKRQMMETLKRMWAEDRGFMPQAELSEWLRFAAECDHVAGSGLHWDALTADYTHVVKSMNTKVLLMIGDSTLGASSIYQRMSPAVPPKGAHFAVLPGGTHCPHFQPELLPDIFRLVQQLLNGSLENNSNPGSSGHAKAHKAPIPQSIGPVHLTQKLAAAKQTAMGHASERSGSLMAARHRPATIQAVGPTMSFIPPPTARLRFMGA